MLSPFARMEASLGVRSTFFVTTKYFADNADIGYYTPERVKWIQQIAGMGFEVGSHSVSHSPTFDSFPLGLPRTTRNTYDYRQPTLFGEALVSKELLDRDLRQRTVGFRAGYLRYPHELHGTLEQSGYTFDSSVSAQAVLTNFPHFGFARREVGSERSSIVVVPVTLDDSRGELKDRDFLRPDNTREVVDVWSEVIRANMENDAMSCLLIHPTEATYKLETERELIERHRGPLSWIGDVGSLARFWSDRSRIRPILRSTDDGSNLIVLNVKRADLPRGQSLVIERRGDALPPQIVDATGEVVIPQVRTEVDRFFLVLP